MTVALIVLDGLGIAPAGTTNAVSLARLTTLPSLDEGPSSQLGASGEDVGLMPGKMGNSNVGHLNIGAGRIVPSDLVRINTAIRDGSLFQNPVVERALATPRLHLLALFSEGGVHSSLGHLLAVVAERRSRPGTTTFLHLLTDGRDVPPRQAAGDISRLGAEVGEVATVGGRFYGMDRDKRWDRTERAYRAIVEGQGPSFTDPEAAIRESYRAGVDDEFMVPAVRRGYTGARRGDVFFILNFRADRARQIFAALSDRDFPPFARARGRFETYAMTRYRDEDAPDHVAFTPLALPDTLGEVVSRAGKTQWRVAETEKYAHVTYFLDGGKEATLPGEERRLIPSPKVRTYDEAPEMSAAGVTGAAVEAIRAGADLVVVNYANADMVGHTGRIPAAVKAVEAVDQNLGRLLAALEGAHGTALVVADHGNAEMMLDPGTGDPHTAHTTNPVPCHLVGRPGTGLRDGILADVAPTVLDLMGIRKPRAMTGTSLLIREGGPTL